MLFTPLLSTKLNECLFKTVCYSFVLKGLTIRECWETNQTSFFVKVLILCCDDSDVSVMDDRTLGLALRNE